MATEAGFALNSKCALIFLIWWNRRRQPLFSTHGYGKKLSSELTYILPESTHARTTFWARHLSFTVAILMRRWLGTSSTFHFIISILCVLGRLYAWLAIFSESFWCGWQHGLVFHKVLNRTDPKMRCHGLGSLNLWLKSLTFFPLC